MPLIEGKCPECNGGYAITPEAFSLVTCAGCGAILWATSTPGDTDVGRRMGFLPGAPALVDGLEAKREAVGDG